MLTEFDFSTLSFVQTWGTCVSCATKFKEGFVYREGEVCLDCKNNLIYGEDEPYIVSYEGIDFESLFGPVERDDFDIGICQGCGGYGILGRTCIRKIDGQMEECGEYL